MRALICGAAGQDGSYLARLLLNKGYEVVGTSRDAMMTSFHNLERLGIHKKVHTASMAINDFRSVLNVVERYRPDEIYNLAGQTSVGLSFEQPVEAMESIAGGTLNLLEVIRFVDRPIRFYNAGSSECFGDTGATAASEQTPFLPRSPYAVAKASAHWLLKNYRDAYSLFACTGVLFNHESPLRPERFVTQKIVRAAAKIAGGSREKLVLGNIDIHRDWGWAPEYVEAMWLMLQQSAPDDFVIATGQTHSLQYFISKVFARFGLDWREHVTFDNSLFRPSDIKESRGNPAKARVQLGWSAQVMLDGVIDGMCEASHVDRT
ncbi:GDP-mannose 4,6-dehydratase [Bradyrhizobium sp. C9]|uniref:GDP-mannose 4,6-dehydratase n=1 Tax=Bradyrhizobium sp. C9 TaxID=142585 RepID=UPI000BE8BE88|nr:GDP-mannose 4,6-dehydratase [Bradyrhizobium sp. C9]PDT74087.1 GDP-mannose 4,6-dehydratase [Bradyrhizobium sp. C9]